MSSRIVTWGTALILLLVLSAQAIDYEAIYKRDEDAKTQPTYDTILDSYNLLERVNRIELKASYSLQEITEHLLYFGALLRVQILDTFGNLLYIHYDDFSVEEVEALRMVYQETFERRYNIFHLVAKRLMNLNTRASNICADIYDFADSCLKISANVCRDISKRRNLPYLDHFVAHFSNATYSAHRSFKISRLYLENLSLPMVFKLLQRGILSITPNLLSGLFYHVKYDNYDDSILFAERQLMRYVNEIAHNTRRSFYGILEPMSPQEIGQHHSMAAFLKYYISVHVERFANDMLKRYALLIVKHLVDDASTTDENIYLLGDVYENGVIHVDYLFDLVLPDDVLHDDVIEAKKYLVNKLKPLNMVERHFKYQQPTPAYLVMEITEQLQRIGFLEDIARTLWIHARFWRRSYMVEKLYELLKLLDAYENLRRVPRYNDMMKNIDKIRQDLYYMQNMPIEILCNAPRACLQNGLRKLLDCERVSPEIKKLVGDFLQQLSFKGVPLNDECPIPMMNQRRDIPNGPKAGPSMESNELLVDTSSDVSETTEIQTARPSTTESKEDSSEITSSETHEFEESANKTAEKLSGESYSEESEESSSTEATESTMYETTEPILTDASELYQEEVTTVAATVTSTTGTTDEETSEVVSENSADEVYDEDSISASLTTPVASRKSCESGDCGEQSLEESNEHEETSATLLPTAVTPMTRDSSLSKTGTTSLGSSSREVSKESTARLTSETLITKGKCTSCPGECDESTGCGIEDNCSGNSCKSGCDSSTEDCTAGCRPSVGCDEESSPEVSTECGTPKRKKSNEKCAKMCSSDNTQSMCEDDSCSPTMQSDRNVCEIPDPRYRQQMRRLAKMRAISAATSHHQDDVFETRWPRRRDRANKLLRKNNERMRTSSKVKIGDDDREKRTYGHKRLYLSANRYGGRKSSASYRLSKTSVHRTKRISRRGAGSVVVPSPRENARSVDVKLRNR